MPVAVTEASVLHTPAQSGRSRSPLGAGQPAEPFSQLLEGPDPAPPSAASERTDGKDGGRAERSPRDGKASAQDSRAEAPAKAAKAKSGKDDKKADTAAAPADGKTAPAAAADTKEPQAETVEDAAPEGDIARSDIDPAAALLALDVLAAAPIDTSVAAVAAPVPVAPAPSAETTVLPPTLDAVSVPEAGAVETIVGNGTLAAAKPAIASAAGITPDDAPSAAASFEEVVAGANGGKTDQTNAAAPKAAASHAAGHHAAAHATKAPEAAAQGIEKTAGTSADAKPNAAEAQPDLPIASDTDTTQPAPEPRSNVSAPAAPQAVTSPATVHSAQAPVSPAAPAAVPVAALAVEIAARAQSGKNRFEIRLDPPELGRIDVRLDVDRDGNVTSRLVVERAETLDLLRRDAPNLERAFQQAGLKTSDNGMQFSLRDQGFSSRENDAQTPAMARVTVLEENLVSEMHNNYGRLAGLRGGIDIRV